MQSKDFEALPVSNAAQYQNELSSYYDHGPTIGDLWELSWAIFVVQLALQNAASSFIQYLAMVCDELLPGTQLASFLSFPAMAASQ
ncbi:unnamed protein product [Pleuronectes platessa]|uniref:Uncharacterized protein n=1 Tax=Pleuronectes platessa TaxID=8262 RepID=A0A9N7W0L1_PLEPL|nr:unnamed protein product [Pleuronectes platessa]